ncbi:LysR family transcriptional regulator [Mycobacteroides abscessus]|nr:LysR family transcriptional regulator [Mycobacteroides abscessus]EUA61354.1 bacterial regulatory helix-turn-helix, lysR family protein [Mycobacteroides abscessus 1948]AKP58571.1 LysR family transcriptional regulator [Mycobacteroides abscessus UC22]ALM16991.1 LysR family transcriptional regulator [Mycobacteroides abscessus]AMU46198.1 LysR family transcriptional regulator [Mycobacteroides abscessus]AMU51091.1 LysR family transcriptional regulator [Mycobacteroides abscessus]
MEIHHLRYFLAVARELSFTKAAQNLHMSVAPLSQRIKALENELGEQLFDRSTHHVELTNAGERLVPLARTIVSDFDALPRKLLLGMPAGAVRVGVTRALNGRSRRTISDVLAELSRDHTYIVNQVASRDMERQLLAGSIDLGVSRVPAASARVQARLLNTERLAILADASAFPAKVSVQLADLRGYTYVHGPEAWEIASMLEAQHVLFDSGVLNDSLTRCDDVSSMLLTLRNSTKITLRSLQSEELKGLDPAEFVLLPIDDLTVEIPTMLQWRAEDVDRLPIAEAIKSITAAVAGDRLGD